MEAALGPVGQLRCPYTGLDTLLNLDSSPTITSPDTDKAEDTMMVEGLENLLVRKDLLDGDQQSSGVNNEDLMSQEPGNAELLSCNGVQQSPVKSMLWLKFLRQFQHQQKKHRC